MGAKRWLVPVIMVLTAVLTVALTVCGGGGSGGGGDGDEPGPVKIIGAAETVFDWTTDRCESEDIPDLPARAFRDNKCN